MLAQRYFGAVWTPEGENKINTREVYFDDTGKAEIAKIYWRPSLPVGFELTGPAIIEEPNSTTVVFPGDKVTVTPQGHLIIDILLNQISE